jgi:hypothetical protein
MSTIYTTFNICGGGSETRNLSKAIENAQDHFMEPYIITKKGKRPVHMDKIGKFGQSYDSFVKEIEEIED